MPRFLLGGVIWLASALSLAAVPARLPRSAPPERLPVLSDLRGTTWQGFNEGVKANWTVHFEPDGSFRYTYGGTTYRNGTWKLEGDRLYYQVNQKYCECVCTVSPSEIRGESWNVRGLRWPIVLHPAPAPK